MSDDHFLSRWSRRKIAAKRGEPLAQDPALPEQAQAPAAAALAPEAASEAPPLPPVESLTPDSDFTPFMRSDVDPNLRQKALRTLFRDERFNVMDGLDVYIDDYSKPDPIPADWLGKLNQMARLGEYRPPEIPAEGPAAPGPPSSSLEKPVDEQTIEPSDPDVAPPQALPESPPPDLKHS